MDKHTPCWYIAVVTPNTEKACEKKLRKWQARRPADQPALIDTYVPSQRELRVQPSTGKRHWIDRVVSPCYLFVYCSEQVRYTIKSECPFIHHFVKDVARRKDRELVTPFAVVSDTQMALFRRMVGDADTPVMIDIENVQIGSEVRIKTGKLEGFTGYIVRMPDKRLRFGIRINALGYAHMEIEATMIEEVK